MANVSSVTKHFPSAKEGFTTTLASSISSGAATLPLNSVTGYNNGEVAVLVVDPGNDSKQVCTGTVDTGGVQLTGVVWTEGTNVAHTAGATVVDYVAATHMSMVSKGILEEHKESGAHGDITADSIVVAGSVEAESFTITGAGGSQGWESGLPAPDTVTYNGNRSYELVFNSTDLTDTLSPGMRMRFTRTATAPTQCTDLESGSSQYWSKSSPSGITFLDDWTITAWVKQEGTTGINQGILSRHNGTSGFMFYIDTLGKIKMIGDVGATADSVESYRSVPWGRWVHIAATLNMSASAGTVYIDGELVGSLYTNNAATAIVQAGDLQVGATNGAEFFDGKIAQVGLFDAVLTAATIRSYASQTLTGSETNCIGAWTFSGNADDLTANNNDFSAQGSATSTNTDSPFAQGPNLASAFTDGTTEFGIVTATTFSTNTTVTVQVPEGSALPTTGGISAVFYSANSSPYGFPRASGKWEVMAMLYAATSQTTPTQNTWYNPGSFSLSVPVGEWDLGYNGNIYLIDSTVTDVQGQATLSTLTNGASSYEYLVFFEEASPSGTLVANADISRYRPATITTPTPYYLIARALTSGVNSLTYCISENATCLIVARCAYL
jgi:hypothetical protein